MDQFTISPNRAPFQYHAWLELNFPLAVKVDKDITGEYESFETSINITILSNVYKVVSGSFWQQGRQVEEWAERVRAGSKESPPVWGWTHGYVTKDRVYDFVKELENSGNTQYVHVEEIPSVVHITASVPNKLVPISDFYINDLSPQIFFISEQIFPELATIIDAYRIAARPWMRYSISPVSEALVNQAFIHYTDRDSIKIGNIHHIFDINSPIYFGKDAHIQARFEQFSRDLSTLQAENQMASAYYLYRMRRWTEALTIASAVVDNLARELVFQIASTEIEAEALLSTFGRGYVDLFNKVFPAFGKPKLSDADKTLWDNFVDAKKSRGAKVHGKHSNPFNISEEEQTKRYLIAFHDVASWLCQQLGREWALDTFDEKGNKLDAFR